MASQKQSYKKFIKYIIGLIVAAECSHIIQGDIRIIDFNDWPSFSRCCDEAAEAIAERLRKMIKAKHRI